MHVFLINVTTISSHLFFSHVPHVWISSKSDLLFAFGVCKNGDPLVPSCLSNCICFFGGGCTYLSLHQTCYPIYVMNILFQLIRREVKQLLYGTPYLDMVCIFHTRSKSEVGGSTTSCVVLLESYLTNGMMQDEVVFYDGWF